ncbi:MAG: M16 family metallopeptidase [Candidatus Heteroscillospira sp.]|jgi:predicted Zn-dependent peptidase
MHEIITLKNGLRIVHEPMAEVRSAAVGVWIGVGSRFEQKNEGGYAHFIEHLLFKGTSSHTAAQLADVMDGIGGQINAYTTRESTCFYARVLDTHLDTAIDLLGEMFFDSLFAEEDVKSERGVIFEEIDMYDDAPEDMVSERLMLRSFPGALGRPILGTRRSLEGATGEALRDFMSRHYTPDRVVVSLCGSYTADHLRRIAGLFGALEAGNSPNPRRAAYRPCFTLRRKATEQNHLCLGFPGLAGDDERRFALHTMSSILGGGMSSRLFQSVREKHGLCYSIYSFTASHADTGLTGICTALNRGSEQKALSLIFDEIRRFCDCGVTRDELSRAVEQAKSSMIMALESSSTRMNRLGSAFTALGSCLTPDEVIDRYDAVTPEQILALARELFTPEGLSFSAVGRLADADTYKAALTL